MTYFLAGDLGGTKTLLALYQATAGDYRQLAAERFRSHDYPDLDGMLDAFLRRRPERPTVAALGVAGPVLAGRARLTNLGWTIDGAALAERFGLRRIEVMNDLVAIANAVPTLTAQDLFTVNEGSLDPHGTIGVMAPGTGLGEAYLCWDGDRYQAYPSEGGHADFAPTTDAELGLLQFLRQRLGHVSYEQVCSGMGIANIHRYCTDGLGMAVTGQVADDLAEAGDPTPVIVSHGLAGDCPVCAKTMALFLDILAAEAGNLAVKFLATGGLYLGGGLPPRVVDAIRPAAFMTRFAGKGRMADLLADIPVYIIQSGDAALAGAARLGARLARRG